jgi:hypothetical protein
MKKHGVDRPNIVKGLKEIKYNGLIATYQADKEGNMLHEVTIYQYDDQKRAKTVEKISVPEAERL